MSRLKGIHLTGFEPAYYIFRCYLFMLLLPISYRCNLVRLKGLEPSINRVEAYCFIQLSYKRMFGDTEGT